MSRILGIDFGKKRTGLATTDPLKIFVRGLETVSTPKLLDWLEAFIKEEEVEKIVLGEPLYPDGNPAQLHKEVLELAEKLRSKFKPIEVVLHDERYTSEEAKRIIIQSGVKKKKRRDKSLVDKVSAVLILEDYLGIY